MGVVILIIINTSFFDQPTATLTVVIVVFTTNKFAPTFDKIYGD